MNDDQTPHTPDPLDTNLSLETAPPAPTEPLSTPLAAPTPDPLAPTPSPESMALPPQKHRLRRLIKWLIILIILLLISIVAGLYFQNPPKSTSTTASTTHTTPIPPAVTAAQLIQNLAATAALHTTYPDAALKATSNGPDSTPTYQPDGANFFTIGNFGTQLTFTLGKTSMTTIPKLYDDTISTAATLFTKNGLAKSHVATGSVSNFNSLDDYQNATVICQINTFANVQPSAADPTDSQPIISCAEKDAYNTLAAKLQPIVTAYYKSSAYTAGLPDLKQPNVQFSDPVITTKPGGYANATLQISSVAGMTGGQYYLYAKDNQWTYLTMDEDQYLPCNILNTPDTEAAFAGDNCYTTSGSTTTVSSHD